jgi:tRNA threonylcarbamoyladenosine biosynthesis protein TsaE
MLVKEGVSFTSEGSRDTEQLGFTLGRLLKGKGVVALHGELGAGKTVFTKGVARGIGIDKPEYVNSPTFTFVKEYRGGRASLFHIDLYRIEDPSELEGLGCRDVLSKSGVVVIEWAERMKNELPDERMEVYIETLSEGQRHLRIEGRGAGYEHIVEKLTKLLKGTGR